MLWLLVLLLALPVLSGLRPGAPTAWRHLAVGATAGLLIAGLLAARLVTGSDVPWLGLRVLRILAVGAAAGTALGLTGIAVHRALAALRARGA